MSKEIAEEYASSLSDLTVNSKPLINMLTILAEENVDHAAVIVDTVEKHLEKVSPEIKLPVLYLVDSIIKNVGGAYTQKFSQSIVNMFTRTFRQVDEKTRSQMFKLRETWHDVFPPTKLYQLDVKVNLIDPAWPIQAQPQQNIHVNPNFLKKPVATASIPVPVQTKEEDEKIRSIVAKKEQELLMLQRKKIEIELEQTKKQLEMAEKNAKQKATSVPVVPPRLPPTMPAALVNPVVTPSLLQQSAVVPSVADVTGVPAKQRLGPPVNSSKAVVGRIAPVSNAMLAATRRDPRLARHQPAGHAPPAPPATIAPNVFDIKPLERVTKRKNVITIDVQTDAVPVRERTRDPRRRDPRLDKSRRDADERNRKPDREKRLAKKEEEKRKREDKHKSDLGRNDKSDGSNTDINAAKPPKSSVDDFIDRFIDAKKITKLPPIPKLNRQAESPKKNSDTAPSPTKRRKDLRDKKAKKDDKRDSSKESSESSPEKKTKARRKKEVKEQPMEVDAEKEDPVQFKELKNYHKERYMRRNKEKSESPEVVPKEAKESAEAQTSNPPEVSENKDVDLRVLPAVAEVPAPLALKRLSTETLDGKAKKSKVDKFDILFGNEDVDLRQLPQVEEAPVPPPPPNITGPASPQPDEKPDEKENGLDGNAVPSPHVSPKTKDWNEEKDKRATSEEPKKMPTELELVRAKLAKATEGKDRLGRPLLFSKSLSVEKERRRTISSSEDIDLRAENRDDEVSEETINMILSQAKQYFKDGKMDKNSYNTLMFQLMQINEGLKLKEAKQRESLEVSKRRLHRTQVTDEEHYVPSPKSSPTNHNRFGDIDERIPPPFIDTPPNSQDVAGKDSDMRIAAMRPYDPMDGPIMPPGFVPRPPMMPPMFMGPGLGPVPPNFRPMWRGARPGVDEYVPRRGGRGNAFFRGKFERLPRPHFLEPRLLPLPLPKLGMFQGECPLKPYVRARSPPPLGTAGESIPPTDPAVLEYIDQDPMKTIDIDGVPREIRFYGETAVIMLDWDDPREIRFLPASRRVTFDNKDSIVLSFNDGYKQVEIDDQVFDIRFGAPTRELFVNGRWYECFFGAPPCGILIDGKPRIIQLEGPPPQVDIRKEKRTDLVAGKINLIVDAKHMCPLFLDGKVQRFKVESEFFTIRFVDSLKTVLINEKPFQVEFGGLPKPINIGKNKHFIRFSVLPKNVRPGQIKIASMEGKQPEDVVPVPEPEVPQNDVQKMETDEAMPRPVSSPSPDGENSNQGNLDMLASVMPSSMAPASSSSGYSLAEPLFSKTDKIPGLEPQTPKTEEPQPPPVTIPMLGNINVNDLFAKLVASGIVQTSEKKEQEDSKKPVKPKEDKTVVHVVDLLRPETLRVKQPALVAKIYGGMQCSGCGARFPPEHTVRYSQHLDWHFRQNRRERDSARRAHSRHWHYDLSDWVQYEEVEDLEEREKSWFETGGAEGEVPEGAPEAAEEAPSVAAGAPLEHRCALCGDKFDQFYNEDKEEWHLRKALKHEDQNYHPLCFEDYKASLAAKEPPLEETIEEIKDIPSPKKLEEPIEIDETIEDINSQSDDESVVEVVETASQKEEAQEPLEIDEGDEDDVVLKAEPVEEVCVDDDNDTDDETTATRAERDKQAEIDFSRVRIKQEPVDPDDEPIITAEEEATKTNADTTSNTVLSSIDGNVQLEATGQGPVLPGGGIRINITKTIPAFISTPADNQFSMLEDVSADDEPLPPGEEPELEYKLKPTLEDIRLSRQPPVQKGSELSGLCSIM